MPNSSVVFRYCRNVLYFLHIYSAFALAKLLLHIPLAHIGAVNQ